MNDRMLGLLEAISAQGPSARPMQLATQTGLPQASAYRLLSELQNLGLIEREGQGYRIGARLSRLVLGAVPAADLREAIGPDLQALADETGETSFAARLTGDGMELFARHLSADGARGGVLPPMGLRPAVCSAAKAIFTFLPEGERNRVIAKANARFAQVAFRDDGALAEEIARISESRFATCFGEEDPDIGSFAAPIAFRGREGLFSVGIVGPRTRIEAYWQDKRQAVREGADRLARRLERLADSPAP